MLRFKIIVGLFFWATFIPLNVFGQDTIRLFFVGGDVEDIIVSINYNGSKIDQFDGSKNDMNSPVEIIIDTGKVQDFQMIDLKLDYHVRGEGRKYMPVPIIFIYDPERTEIIIMCKPEERKGRWWFQALYLPAIENWFGNR